MLKSPILTYVLVVGLLFGLVILFSNLGAVRLPGNQQGYEPAQPIAYSHRLHAGELQLDCLYCHFGALTSRHAGIPPANVCMNCHKFITAPLGAIRAEDELAAKEAREPRRIISPELRKLYDAFALNDELNPDPTKKLKPIEWVKVHNLPDFAYFDHRAHVQAGVTCQECHGPIESMERVRQALSLNMGWCVNCHRRVNQQGISGKAVFASLDCATCHY
jgi:hypothetical protein